MRERRDAGAGFGRVGRVDLGENQPAPRRASARTSPQGSTIIVWPKVGGPRHAGRLPLAATTKAPFSMARARLAHANGPAGLLGERGRHREEFGARRGERAVDCGKRKSWQM